MGEMDDKIDLASSKQVDSDAESIVGPLPAIVEPIPLTTVASNSTTRSRRPSLMRDPLEPPLQLQKSTISRLEPAVSEKWTAKRIAKVTWAYVTTVKVILSHSLARRLTVDIGFPDYTLYAQHHRMGRHVVSPYLQRGTSDVHPDL
jgi:hypothetical protein